MKRLFLILILFGTLLLCGCRQEHAILDYQNKDISAECVINGKYRAVILKNNKACTVEIIEPKEAQGISFEIGEKAYAVTGNTKIEIDKSHIKGICALSEIFSQSEECMTSAAEQGKGSVLTFQKEECTYQITLGENSIPKRVKIISEAFEYDVEICAIELTS